MDFHVFDTHVKAKDGYTMHFDVVTDKKDTEKAKKVLKWFSKQKIDILLHHQPPHGVLDKVTFKKAPKHWLGKHAGSKVILNFIKKIIYGQV